MSLYKRYKSGRYYSITGKRPVGASTILAEVARGVDVCVADAETGEDITTDVLLQNLTLLEPTTKLLHSFIKESFRGMYHE